MSNDQKAQFDVAVVGCGPVGLAMIHLLGQKGISVVGIESTKDVMEFPRASHLDDEILRIFQALDVAYELEPAMLISTDYEYFDEKWNRFLKMKLKRGYSDQGWRYDYQFHQPDFEKLLRQKISQQSHVSMLFGQTVAQIVQNEDFATVTIEDTDNGHVQKVTARYVVGCDGARSTVRKIMGTPLEDFNGTQRWLITDVYVHDDVELPSPSFEYCHSERPVTYIIFPDRRRRFEFKLRDEDQKEDMETVERVHELLRPWVAPEHYRIERKDVYHFHGLLAKGWRNGRLMIAGDAAHQMPPKLGQGLCSGYRDVMNLAWKLAMVLHGQATESLLDTYETERSPHVRWYIQTSVDLAIAIDQMQKSQNAADTQEFGGMRITLGPGIHGDDGEPAGTLSAQPRLNSGKLLDDQIGYHFVLIGEQAIISQLSLATKACLEAFGAAVVSSENEPEVSSVLSDLGARAVIIRPDRYILGTASTSAALDALVSRTMQPFLTLELDDQKARN